MRQRPTLFWTCILALVGSGCGGSPGSGGSGESRARTALAEVGEIYRIYTASNNKPPTQMKDFDSLRPVGPIGVREIDAGNVVVLYGAKMTDLNDGPASTPSDQVLAYEKKAPESGGEVLLLDRSIKTMTAEQFKAAPKAVK